MMAAGLAPLFVAAALVSLFQLLRSGPAGPAWLSSGEANAVHVVMNLVMALMALPCWAGGWRTAGTTALWIAGAGLAIRLIGHRGDGSRVAASLYHLLGVGAMIYAAGLMAPAMPGMAMHAHHHGAGGGWIAAMLGWLFVADGVATALLVTLAPRLLLHMEAELSDGAASGTLTRDLRLSAVPHIVMDAGMALMLL